MDQMETPDKEKHMMEPNSTDKLGELASPRILNNHRLLQEQPTQIFDKKVKVVFVYRNVKDVAVSYYHHHTKFFDDYGYKAPFSNYLKRLVAGLVEGGNVFEYLAEWEEGILNNPNLNAHVVSYEDMKKDNMGELRKLSHFLGTRDDDVFLQQVSDTTNFQTMKERKMKDENAYRDESGQLIMYRKGQIGDWKNYFTVAESEWFDLLIEKHLGNSKLFNFRYV